MQQGNQQVGNRFMSMEAMGMAAVQASQQAPPPPPELMNMHLQQQRVTPTQTQINQLVNAEGLTGVKRSSCDKCTHIKVKCNGAHPCARCEKKELHCVYSTAKKRGPPKGRKRGANLNPAMSSEMMMSGGDVALMSSGSALKRSRGPKTANERETAKYPTNQFDKSISVDDIRERIHEFSTDRDWNKFHTPRNLVMALVGEMGELAEIFQWKGETKPGLQGWSHNEKMKVADELADVMIYLTRLSDRCDIDLGRAVYDKIQKNAQKYPTLPSRGSNNSSTQASGSGGIF